MLLPQAKLVAQLLLKGMKNSGEISKTLRSTEPPTIISPRTVDRYKYIIKRRNEKLVKTREGIAVSVEEMGLKIKQNFELVVNEMWKQYHQPLVSASVKKDLLVAIRDTCAENLKLLQSLGLIFERPQEHQFLDDKGNPTNPPNVEINIMDQQFTAFIKATYQLPLGVDKAEGVGNAQ